MTVLYILGAVCILAAALLLTPVGVRFLYEDHTVVWVKIGFVSVRVVPRKEKPRKPVKKKAKKPRHREKPPTHILIETVRSTVRETGRLITKLRVRRLDFHMLCAGPDAAAAAIQYGQVCAVAGIILPVLEKNLFLRRPGIRLEVDYIKTAPEIRVDLIVTVLTVHVLRAALVLAVKYIKAIFEDKSKNAAKMPPRKQEAEI